MQHIADRINSAMKRDGLSLTRLAEASAMPRMTLSRRLADPADFTLGELERVASAIGMTADQLATPLTRKRKTAA